MKNLSEYIQHLDFAYLKTYSGFSQEIFDIRQARYEQTIAELRQRIETASPQKQKILSEKMDATRLRWEIEQFDFQEIVGPDGMLNDHAIAIAHLPRESPAAHRIMDILTVPFREQDLWMCPPVFRDAIVFYNADHSMAGMVYICFSCGHLADYQRQLFETDNTIFPLLRSELKSLGHKIK